MGDLFGVNLTPSNRYGGFKVLRERWRQHIQSTLFRPILLVDEAQEMITCNLNELRLLGSAHFDSECLLTVILCGDRTLPDRFRSNQLLALGSRIRFRRMLSPYDKKELRSYLEYCLQQAGAPQLMTKPLMTTLVEHSAGNLRLLNVMAAELLTVAAQRELTQLDEQLFLELYSPTPQKKQPR
jgi:type II secretory pathway predicted ATPase ExeA